jgi:hypothetical protein
MRRDDSVNGVFSLIKSDKWVFDIAQNHDEETIL